VTGPGTSRPDVSSPSSRRAPHPNGRRHRLTRVHHCTRSEVGPEALGARLGRFSYGAAATTSSIVVFERNGYQGFDPKTGRARWHLDPVKGVAGVAGIAGPDLYLTGGCPVTSAD
jgi:hypothetical protein